jgi:hypothetical protein
MTPETGVLPDRLDFAGRLTQAPRNSSFARDGDSEKLTLAQGGYILAGNCSII